MIWTVLIGWGAFVAGFLAGTWWLAAHHRCKPIHVVGIHEVDDAYLRGALDERARRDEEIRWLDKVAS